MAEVGWVLDHLWDLAADFRAFFHLAPGQAMKELSGPEFLALAYRAPAYGGSLAARMQHREQDDRGPDRRRTVVGTREAVQAEGLGGLIDFE